MQFDSSTCKALRAERGLTQAKLAKAASVSQKTISDFEKGKTTPQPKTISAICSALEEAGAVLSPNKTRAGGGARWVTASDLDNWADTKSKKLQNLLPEIVRRLIRSTANKPISTDFRAGDSTYVEGWDGIVQSSDDTQYIPLGQSGWEMGCDKSNTSKANSDYKNRKNNSHSLDTSFTTFVFVSPRRWKGRASWVDKCLKEKFWKDVRGLDADDLEQWLMQAPHVSAWLAKEMGKYTAGVEHIYDFWESWRARTNPELNALIVLAGRQEVLADKKGLNGTNINNWLQAPSGLLAVQGETEDEAIAFLAAALETLKDDPEKSNFQRCLIVDDKDAYRSVSGEPTPMILVIPDSLREFSGAAIKLGHHVFIPLGKDSHVPQKNGIQLPLLNRNAFVEALQSIGYSEDEADDLCRETGRSLPVLQRLKGVSRSPTWANPVDAQSLIPALLIGAWDEDNENDRAALSSFTNLSYHELGQVFTRWAKEADAPLRHIGTLWRHTSRLDSWRLLAPHISNLHIEKLDAVIEKALGARDPSVDTPPKDRWLITEKIPYSKPLREGLLQTLILLATKTKNIDFQAIGEPEEWSNWQVAKLLDKASEERWYSLAEVLPLVSEAAPMDFLEAVEDSLEQPDRPIMKLFESGESVFGSDGSVHSSLLWALENLAWDPEYLSRVTRLLGRLDQIDPGGNLSNRPANSLKEIFILWLTHTYADLNQRLAAIDILIDDEPDSAWKLLLAILPTGSDISSITHKMRWREISTQPPQKPTDRDVRKAVQKIIPRLLKLSASSISRCCDLLKKYQHLPTDSQKEIIAATTSLIVNGLDATDSDSLTGVLRSIISHHRQFPEAEWSMSGEEIAPLADLIEKLVPKDIIDRHCWLFNDHWVTLMEGTRRSNDEAVKDARIQALQEIFDAHGMDGLIKLSEKSLEPGVVGRTAAELLPASDIDWQLLAYWLNSEHPVTLAGRSFVRMREHSCGEEWLDLAIKALSSPTKNTSAIFEFFASLPETIKTWTRLEAQSTEVQEHYWKNAKDFYIGESKEDLAYAVEKLLIHDRPIAAFYACNHVFGKLPSHLLLDVLARCVSDEDWRPGGYDIDKAFEALDAATNISQDDIVGLEWQYAMALNRYGEGRGTKALHQRMAKTPRTFVDMLTFTYKHEDENQDKIQKKREGLSPKNIQNRASNANRVLDSMRIIPGTRPGGTIHAKNLRIWHQETRDLAEKAGRLRVCDINIGELFAHANEEEEYAWPPIVICEAIEEIHSRSLDRGFITGVYNKRGTVTKAYNEGGRQEYNLASKFHEYAKTHEGKYPRVAAILHKIAHRYEGEGRHADQDAMARDLRS